MSWRHDFDDLFACHSVEDVEGLFGGVCASPWKSIFVTACHYLLLTKTFLDAVLHGIFKVESVDTRLSSHIAEVEIFAEVIINGARKLGKGTVSSDIIPLDDIR